MSWHYVAAREAVEKQYHGSGEYRYTVREYFDASNGYGTGWTDPIEPDGETLDELIETLERMLADVKRFPVIDDETGKEVTEWSSTT